MNLIHIEGAEATVLGLRDISDIILVLSSGESIPGGRIRVAAYATDRAITEIEARGVTVTVLMNNAELKAHMDELYNQIEASEPPVG